MMLRSTLVILRKELIGHLRDLRSMAAALVLPISGPLFFAVLMFVMASWIQEKPLKIPVQGAQNAPSLMTYLRSEGIDVLPVTESPEAAVKSGKAKVGLIVEDNFGERLRQGRPADVTVVMDRSVNSAAKDVQRVQRALTAWSGRIGTLRLLARGVDPSLAQPVRMDVLDVATPAQRAAQMLTMIPLFLMMAAFIGGLNLVIDMTAGERERGSLEPLLLTAVPRASVTLGKWAAAVIVSFIVTVLCLVLFAAALRISPLEELGIPFTLSLSRAIQLLAVLTPLTFVGAALELVVATFARSFKEAQTWLSFFSLVPTVPAMAVVFSPFDSAVWMSAVPVLAQQSLVLDVLKLNPVPGASIAILWGTSIAYTALALVKSESLFRKESVIYGR